MPALITVRDYIYGALIGLILIAGTVFTVHERNVGAQKVAASDARAAAIQQKHDTDVQAAAQAATAKALSTYHAQVTAPVLPAPSLVCHVATANSGRVPAAPAASGRSDGPALPSESTGPGFDPAERVLAVGRQGDAQIALLQAYIRACQKAGVCRTK